MAQRVSIGELTATLLFRDETGPGLTSFERGLKRAERGMRTASRVAFGMGAALTAAAVGSLKAFADLESKVSEVAAKTGLSTRRIRQDYLAALRVTGQETGRTDTELLDGLAKALSAGLRGQEALGAVDAAARAAAAGIGTIDDQVSSATTLMAVFGGTAQDALDTITRAAQVGEGETADFAAALKGVSGFAAQLGLTAEGTAAGLAAVSQVAASVPEGMTQMRSFLQSLLSPTEQARKEVDALGLSFADLRETAAREGLGAVLARIRALSAGDPERLARLLGRTEAQAFALSVDPAALDRLTADVATTFRGSIDRAFAEGEDDLARNMARLRETFRDLLEDMGAEIAPAALDVVKAVQGMVKVFAALPTPFKRAVATGMLFGPVLLGIAGALRVVAGGIGPVARGLVLLGQRQALAAGATAEGVAQMRAGKLAATGFKTALRGFGALSVVGGLLLILTHWNSIVDAIGRAIGKVREYFTEQGRMKRERRRAVEGLEAHVIHQEALLAAGLEVDETGLEEARAKLERERVSFAIDFGESLAGLHLTAEDRDKLISQAEAKLAEVDARIAETHRQREAGEAHRQRVSEENRAVASVLGYTRIDPERQRETRQEEDIRLAGERRDLRERIDALRRIPDAGGTLAEPGAEAEGTTGEGAPVPPPSDTRPDGRIPPPERVEVKNVDVVEAVWDLRTALVRELRLLGVVMRGEELPAHLATRALEATPAEPVVTAEAPDVDVAVRTDVAAPAVPDLRAHVEAPELPTVDLAAAVDAALLRELEALRSTELAVVAAEPIPFPEAIALEPVQAPVTAPAAPEPFRAVDDLTKAATAAHASHVSHHATDNRSTMNLGGVRIAPGAITVNAVPGQSPEAVAEAVTDRMEGVLRDQLGDLLEDTDSRVVR